MCKRKYIAKNVRHLQSHSVNLTKNLFKDCERDYNIFPANLFTILEYLNNNNTKLKLFSLANYTHTKKSV